MKINPHDTDPRNIYFTMIDCIAPRPIAWVSTLNEQEVSNLAPFSYFSGVGSKPPTLLFCPGFKPDGTPKDTLANIVATKEFVVNVVPFALAEKMNATSANFEEGVSEFEACGIESLPSEEIKAPRVAEAPVAFECTLYELINVGSGNVVIGEIRLIHVADEILNAQGRIDADKLDLVGRMGGLSYSRTTERFELPRPKMP